VYNMHFKLECNLHEEPSTYLIGLGVFQLAFSRGRFCNLVTLWAEVFPSFGARNSLSDWVNGGKMLLMPLFIRCS
jgi:hypothetical protein